MVSLVKFYQAQKEELMLIFLKLFPKKWKKEKHFQTYSLWPALVCIKARQNTKRKDSQYHWWMLIPKFSQKHEEAEFNIMF